MYPFSRLIVFALAFISFATAPGTGMAQSAAAQSPDGLIRSRLVPSHSVQAPGQPVTLAWEVTLEPEWHIYWSNAGDSGLPPELKATGSAWSVGNLAYPTPKLISMPPVTNYGYADKVVLLGTLTPQANQPAGQVNIPLELGYLYCKDICLPGKNTLNLNFEIGATPVENPAFAELLEAHTKSLPIPLPEGAALTKSGKTYALELPDGISTAGVRFMPAADGLIDDSAEQTVTGKTLMFDEDGFQPQTPEKMTGVLLAGGQGYTIELPVKMQAAAPAAAGTGTPTLPLALLFAFLAGLILNLMPCVLPVLALKVLGLARHHHGPARIGHTAAYTGGVLVCFWAFAAIIYLLQQGGSALGWGFHLQSPGFVAFLALVLLGVALNLFGLFEIGGRLTRLGQKPSTENASGTRALLGSFGTGVLAVVVATPCTVPFMGGAMAFALSQSLFPSLLTFTALGLGLAAPFVLFAAFPRLIGFMPKPGQWMNTFKTLLGWPMLATALWLTWVFSMQTNNVATFGLLALAVVFAFTLWVYGMKGRWYLAVAPVVILLWGVGGLIQGTVSNPASLAEKPAEWSPAAVLAARAEGRPVFVDFTADWCITCKVMEATVINTPTVQGLFADNNVKSLVADWTRQDAAITQELLSHGRRGVPLYLLYKPGQTEPLILPQVLTPGIIKDALEK